MAEGAGDIPLLIGNAATEATWFMGSDMRNFDLQDADAHRRIGRYLRIERPETNRIVEAYRATLSNPTPTDLLIAIVTDFQFRKNTMNFAAMRADGGSAPVYYYVFDWRTPVYDGLLRTPHTLEVPFVFGSTEVAMASVGTGPEIEKLTRTVQSIWANFARTGSPQSTATPDWPQYQSRSKPAMMINLEPAVAMDPGGPARQAIASLPAYEYSVPLSYARP